MATDSTPFPTSTPLGGSYDDDFAKPQDPLVRSGALGDSGASATSGGTDLIDRVKRSAHATIDRLADTAAPHVNKLSERLNEAGERVHDSAGQMRQVGDEWTESLRTTVREHPLAALGTALALGLVIARLTR